MFIKKEKALFSSFLSLFLSLNSFSQQLFLQFGSKWHNMQNKKVV